LKATQKSRVWGITAEEFSATRQTIMEWNVQRFDQRQQFIHSIPLFQKLEQHGLLNLTHACSTEIYDADEYVIARGEMNSNVYIIMEGTVIVTYHNREAVSDEHERDRDIEMGDGDEDEKAYEMSSPAQFGGDDAP